MSKRAATPVRFGGPDVWEVIRAVKSAWGSALPVVSPSRNCEQLPALGVNRQWLGLRPRYPVILLW